MANQSGTRERTLGRRLLSRRLWVVAAGVGLTVAIGSAQQPATPPLSLKPLKATPVPPAPEVTPTILPAGATVQPAPIPGTVTPVATNLQLPTPTPLPGGAQPMPMTPGLPGGLPPQPMTGTPGTPGAGELPQPRQFGPFREGMFRLPAMGQQGPLGSTPRPTPETIAKIRGLVERVIDPEHTFDLVVGRARVLQLKLAPTQTQVADPTVLDMRPLPERPTELAMIGRRTGTTVLNLWFPDPNNKGKEVVLSYLVRVIPDPEATDRLKAIYKALEEEVNKAFPNSRIELHLVGEKLMVTGQAHDIFDATQILRILRANAPGGDAALVPVNSVNVNVTPGDPANPTGTPGIESYLLAGGPNVINNMRVPGEQQIMLRVTVAEVNRAAARSIGLNFSITNNQGVTVFAQNTGPLGALTGVNLPIALDSSGQVPLLLSALRNLNYAKSIAEPMLVTMNGQSATFLAGGSFPVPVVGGFGTFGAAGGGLQGVQFVPFGVQLAFQPIITDRDRIRLTLNTSVSTRDLGSGTNIGGSNVSGLSQRNFSTTVEMREGQTLAIAGLVQTNLGANSARVPLLGDIPYLNRLASVDRTSSSEQELIVLITPELTHPLEQTERPPVPGVDIFEPGDWEFYLMGRLESRRSYDYRSPVRTTWARMKAYRRCETSYIFGPTGHVELTPQLPLP